MRQNLNLLCLVPHVSIILTLLTITVFSPHCVATPDSPSLVTGKQLHDQLKGRKSVNASGLDLRQAVHLIQKNTDIATVLDRRINPSALVDLATGYATTQETMEALATTANNATVSVGDHFVLIGPAIPARRLQTLMQINRDSVAKLRRTIDADAFKQLTTSRECSWTDLSEPRQILTNSAERAGLLIGNPELIPHDLWAAATLPPLPFADFATLILNQFDLTFNIENDGMVQLLTVPKSVAIERKHRMPARQKEEVSKRITDAFPEAPVTWKGSTVYVTATVETHEAIEAMLSGNETPATTAAGIPDRFFTMQARPGTTFGQLIASFRASGIPIRIEGISNKELGPLLQQSVDFNVTRVKGATFFPNVFAPWNADVTVTDKEVVVTFP